MLLVFSTGTLIDTLRFRVHLADRLRVRPRDVQATVVGEHGTSEVLLWSSASVGGIPVLELLAHAGESLDHVRQEIENDIRYANMMYEPVMNDDERAGLEHSVAALRAAAKHALAASTPGAPP